MTGTHPAHNPYSVSPRGPRKKHSLLLTVAIVVLVAISASAAFAYAYVSRHTQDTPNESSRHSLILYYRDGKTVLWDSSKDQDSDTETSGFVVQVKDDLAEAYGGPAALKKGDWRVTTTLDAQLQQKAKEIVDTSQPSYARRGIKSGALIAEDVTNGQIVSWLGGFKDFNSNPDGVSRRTMVGTLAVPLTYASLIENTSRYGAGSVLTDEQGPLEGYPCTNKAMPAQGGNCLYNFDYRYVGQITLRQALGTVRLVPVTRAGEAIGTQNLVNYFDKLLSNPGMNHFVCYQSGSASADLSSEDETPCRLPAAHGDGLYARPQDIIQAYATLANRGKSVRQVSFLSATVDGKAKQLARPAITQALRPDTAYIISDILSDPSSSYLPAVYSHIFSANGSKVSVQTGVTNNATAASMIQYTNTYAVGFWGFAQGTDRSIRGSTERVIQPTLTEWLSAAQAAVTSPPSSQSKPSSIQELPSTPITFKLPTGMIGPSPAVDLYPSWYR